MHPSVSRPQHPIVQVDLPLPWLSHRPPGGLSSSLNAPRLAIVAAGPEHRGPAVPLQGLVAHLGDALADGGQVGGSRW